MAIMLNDSRAQIKGKKVSAGCKEDDDSTSRR